MSQPVLDGMPAPLYPTSPTRLATFSACPRRYLFGYLRRPAQARGGPWASSSVGASVHTALARWWTLDRVRRTPQAGGRLLVEAWLRDGFRDVAQSLAARRRAQDQVVGYLAAVDPDDVPAGVEHTVGVRTARAALWGRVDRTDDRAEDGLVVVDYKTGRHVPTVEDVRSSLALAVYAAGVARTFRRACTRVELHHLPSGRVVGFEHTAESLDEHLHRADALAGRLAQQDRRYHADPDAGDLDQAFPPRVGAQCGRCDFWSVCDPGRSAVPRNRPWDGIDL